MKKLNVEALYKAQVLKDAVMAPHLNLSLITLSSFAAAVFIPTTTRNTLSTPEEPSGTQDCRKWFAPML